jgi:hypothetical protein
MSEWNRSTHDVALESIDPEGIEAIHQHIERYNLGPILDETRLCIETSSEKKKKGLFGGGGNQVLRVSIILTPRWLVVVLREKSGISVRSMQLRDMLVVDYASTPGYKLIPDAGVEISGAFTGATGEETAALFIGLGAEPAALKFKQTLIQAVQEARK